jgi:hypothetical protein
MMQRRSGGTAWPLTKGTRMRSTMLVFATGRELESPRTMQRVYGGSVCLRIKDTLTHWPQLLNLACM